MVSCQILGVLTSRADNYDLIFSNMRVKNVDFFQTCFSNVSVSCKTHLGLHDRVIGVPKTCVYM